VQGQPRLQKDSSFASERCVNIHHVAQKSKK
jgi:hypothetical protein